MAGLKVVTPPAAEPVTLDEAKDHLRVDGADDDTSITAMIKAAREYCEGYQNRVYITQTLELALDDWPSGNEIELPRPPLQSVTSLIYKDNGVDVTWPASNYIVDDYSFVARLVLAKNVSWPSVDLPSVNGIKIQYVAGYLPDEGDPVDPAANVPQHVKQAIMLLIGHWYENREAVLTGSISKEVEFAVHALLSLDRVMPV